MTVSPQILRFAASAGVSFALVLGVTTLLREGAHWSPAQAYGAALTVAFFYNFWANRYWVFTAQQGSARAQGARFLVSSVLFRLGEGAVFSVLARRSGEHYLVLAAAVQGLSFLLKFGVFQRLVFR
jgi:putative flippase GtrA